MGDIGLGLVAMLVVGWNIVGWRQAADLAAGSAAAKAGLEPGAVAGRDSSADGAGSQDFRGRRDVAVSRGREESGEDDPFVGEVRRMETSEIIDALRALFGASRGEREEKMGWLMEELARRDPVRALEAFPDRIGDEQVSWYLAEALGQWAARDVVAAAAWLDSRIESGAFESKSLDGRSVSRMEFEGVLTSALLGSDPKAAARRVGMLPEGQRTEVLDYIDFASLGMEAKKGYVSIVRSLLPEGERAGVFAQIAAAVAPDEGYGGVDQFLVQIGATTVERGIVASETAGAVLSGIVGERPLTREDIDEMRSWLGVQSPEGVDRITGEALGLAASEDGELDFQRASEWVLGIQRESGNDAVLVAFLESFAALSHPEQALPLAESVKDPELRAGIIRRLK